MNPNHLAAHVGAGVTMRLDLFEKFSEGFDPEAKAAVLENLRLGFPLGVEEPPPPWAPSFLSDKSRTRITSYFEAEVSDRRMLGPFTTPPLPVNIGARQSPSRSRRWINMTENTERSSTCHMIGKIQRMRKFRNRRDLPLTHLSKG